MYIFSRFQAIEATQLETHLAFRHVNLKENRCVACNWQNSSVKLLAQHVVEFHVNPEPSTSKQCHKCKKVFKTSKKAQAHFVSAHVYKCALCDQSFATDSLLVHHVQATHKDKFTDEVVIEYDCPDCAEEFLDAMQLSKHLREKHPSNTCLYCGERRSSTASVSRHIDVVHFDIRKYPCHLCNHRFTCSRDLKKHSKLHDVPPLSPKGKKVVFD